jgi:hypothetical protein
MVSAIKLMTGGMKLGPARTSHEGVVTSSNPPPRDLMTGE